MNEPLHLLSDPNTNETDRAILQAWRSEQPTEHGRAKTLVALGLASSVSTIGVATGLASVPPKAAAAATFSIYKWLTITGWLFGVIAASFVYVRASSREATTTTAAKASGQVPQPSVAAATSTQQRDVPPTVDVEDGAAKAVTRPSQRSEEVRVTQSSSINALGAQIELIDSAREALAGGEPSRAETLAESYESRFPKGPFSEEAQTLRITALSQSGNEAKADTLASGFLKSHPSSLYAPRVRALLNHAKP